MVCISIATIVLGSSWKFRGAKGRNRAMIQKEEQTHMPSPTIRTGQGLTHGEYYLPDLRQGSESYTSDYSEAFPNVKPRSCTDYCSERHTLDFHNKTSAAFDKLIKVGFQHFLHSTFDFVFDRFLSPVPNSCDRYSGKCICEAGFEGDACQRSKCR